jgi:uncharacterized protein
MTVTLEHLRRYAIARSLFKPTTLPQAIKKLGFVQADPIRAPARAQDLTLRHRVIGYRAGDLEQRYARLPIEEDFFVNYGFVPRATQALMHPRTARHVWTKARWAQAQAVLEFVHAKGQVHPREVDAHFAHGKVKNWFGGNSNASTQLLDGMHYRGLLRIAGRDSGVRLYAAREVHAPTSDTDADTNTNTALDALVDVVIHKYAPLPERSMSELISRLQLAAPQWSAGCKGALARAKARLPSVQIEGQRWYWPAGENPASTRHAVPDQVRLLAPFDPVVWDRRRFEIFWGWAYRFEAYTPAAKRLRGYYALPLLWHEQVVGWGNLAWREGVLTHEIGFVSGKAPAGGFKAALREELTRIEDFLRPTSAA